jgi:hypothetical protein
MPSRISLNIHGLNVSDRNRLFRHLEALQPTAVLVLDNLAIAREIKQLLPNATVIFREFGSQGDGGLHRQSGAEEWLNRHEHQAEDGIVLHVLNEPPFDQPVITWLTDLLRLAAPRRIPLIVGNWAVGNPIPEQWPMARDMLQLIDQHRDLFILGLHEYAGGVITSGLHGGYPDNAGVQPGKPGGMNLVQPANWPQDASSVTRYHMGRFKFLLDYCDSAGIGHPRIILTEHGFDDTSDIKVWEDTLKKTSPYLNVRGWKTLTTQWQEWFGPLGWSPERAFFEQLKWADQTIYQNSPVEAQCIFCWGHSSKEWFQFDVAEATEFQGLLEAYAQQAPSSKRAAFVAPTIAATPVEPQPVAPTIAVNTDVPPPPPPKPTIAPIGQRSPEEIAAANGQPTVAPVGVRVDAPQPTTPAETKFIGSVVEPAPKTLDEALTDEDIAVIVPGLRAAAASGMFSQPVNDGFTRLADVLERLKAS